MRNRIVGVLILVLAACSGGGGGPVDPPGAPPGGPPGNTPTPPAANEVSMVNFAFSPQTRTVSAGTTVRWINNDNEVHTVEPQGHTAWQASGNIGSGQSFSATLNTPGTYAYRCGPHPTMTGTIIVQ